MKQAQDFLPRNLQKTRIMFCGTARYKENKLYNTIQVHIVAFSLINTIINTKKLCIFFLIVLEGIATNNN